MLNALPIADITVDTQVIPGEITCCVVFANCKHKCKGCHSDYLCDILHKDLWTPLDVLNAQISENIDKGCTAVCIMGGDFNEGVHPRQFLDFVEDVSFKYPTGVYVGAVDNSYIVRELRSLDNLVWLKTGPYKRELGGLESRITNQRFYTKFIHASTAKSVWFNDTDKFTKGAK